MSRVQFARYVKMGRKENHWKRLSELIVYCLLETHPFLKLSFLIYNFIHQRLEPSLYHYEQL